MPSEAEKAAAVQAYSDYISKALKGGAGRWHVSDAVIAALDAAERVRRVDDVVRHIAADRPGQTNGHAVDTDPERLDADRLDTEPLDTERQDADRSETGAVGRVM